MFFHFILFPFIFYHIYSFAVVLPACFHLSELYCLQMRRLYIALACAASVHTELEKCIHEYIRLMDRRSLLHAPACLSARMPPIPYAFRCRAVKHLPAI